MSLRTFVQPAVASVHGVDVGGSVLDIGRSTERVEVSDDSNDRLSAQEQQEREDDEDDQNNQSNTTNDTTDNCSSVR